MANLDIDFQTIDKDEATIERNIKDFQNANISPKKLLLHKIK
jgi:hypothetical protein